MTRPHQSGSRAACISSLPRGVLFYRRTLELAAHTQTRFSESCEVTGSTMDMLASERERVEARVSKTENRIEHGRAEEFCPHRARNPQQKRE